MKREYLQILATDNFLAANEMVTRLAAGIYAGGTVRMIPKIVADGALDTAEYILSHILSDEDNMESGDDD